MKKTNKKGFTIVELVIVIAVIAILAAVLIPNISRLVRKANESSDIQLIRNMNTAMQVESVGGANHYDTAHGAITVAAAAGYDLTKIALSDKENTILWDEENQCFAYLRKGESKPEYVPNSKKDNNDTPSEKLWKVETDVEKAESSKYSVYWNGGDIATITVKNVGFDAGTANIGTVNYTGDAGKTVVIRTNGGKLNVTAPNDTIHHYDFVKTLSIEAVSSDHCYYEHGFVGTLEKFESGKFVTTSTAQFYQKAEEIESIFAGKDSVTADFATVPKYEQNIYDENEVSIIDGKPSANHVHKWNDGEVVQSRNCGQEGRYKFTCLTCKEEQTKVESPTGIHSFNADGKCTVCGKENDRTTGEVTISVDSFLALKDVIENIPEDNNGVKEVQFKLNANLATSATSLITQPYNTKVILDLNGCTLTLYNSKYDEAEECYTAGFITRGYFEVTDTSAEKTGKIIASASSDNDGNGGLITVEKTNRSGVIGKVNTQFVLKNGTIDATNNANGCAIMMWHSGSVTIDGGKVLAIGYAISGSEFDSKSFSQGKLIINDGSIESTGAYAIYHPQSMNTGKDAEFTIQGGTIKGKSGVIYLKKDKDDGLETTLSIEGGELISDGDWLIYVDSTGLYSSSKHKVYIYVKGGLFKSTKANASFVRAEMSQPYKFNGKYKQGSAGVFVYLTCGAFTNISQENFISCLDYYGNSGKSSEKTEFFKEATFSNNCSATNNTDGSWTVAKNG